MKLQRYSSWSEPMSNGAYVRWSDVVAMLAEIRRLVDAERGENYTLMDYGPHREALDALLNLCDRAQH